MTNATPRRVAAIIAAAGSGSRLGSDIPKAFVLLNGLSLLTRSALVMSAVSDVIVVAAPRDHLSLCADMLSEVDAEIHVVEGGASRQESVALALQGIPEDVDVVLVHDAARAVVPIEVCARVINAVRDGNPAVIPVLPVVDTLNRVDPQGFVVDTVNRDNVRRVQTPQGFTREVLMQAHQDSTHIATDDAGLLATLGIPVLTVLGHERGMKITTPEDLVIAEHYVKDLA